MGDAESKPRAFWSSLRLLSPRLWVPLLAVLAATVAVAGLSEWSARRALASGNRVADVLHRMDALADLRSLVVDVETAQRGYLLTRDPIYLQPFARAVRQLPEAQRQVRELTAGMPGIDAALDRLDQLIASRIALATRIVEAYNAGHQEEALSVMRAGEDRRLMDEFRAQLAGLELRSQRELLQLQHDQAQGAIWSRTGLLVMTLVNLGLLFILTRLLIAEAVRQENLRCAAEHEARELEKLVEARTRELSELSTHLQRVTEKEKSELARNLHDELGGLLTAAKMDLSWLQSRLNDPAIQERLAQLGSVLDDAMDLKRRVVEDLRPSLLEHFGLSTALRAHFESACAKAGLECEVDVPDNEPVPREIAIALFRVVQEGLTNVIRHARARHVRLQMTSDTRRYLLRLSDDGCGMDLQDSRFRWSHGLTGMRHRVRALGGRFTMESSPGRGTVLRVEVPKAAGGESAAA